MNRLRPAIALVVLVLGAGLAGAQLPVATPSLPPAPVATPTPPAGPTPSTPPVAAPEPAPTPAPTAAPSVPRTPNAPAGPRRPRGRRPTTSATTVAGTPLTISGNRASATVAAGGVSIEVTVEFENVSNLTATSLGLTSRLATPTELGGRLPAGVTPALPLIFTIEPPRGGGLGFHGVAYVSVHTHDLNYVADSPLRLYSGPIGGTLADITETAGAGSYRARGSKGGFSDFVIVADSRTLDEAIVAKLDALEALLDASAGSIPDAVEATLGQQLQQARDAWAASDYRGGAEALEAFAQTVQAHSGAGEIPDRWRSQRDLVNTAGLLRAAAGTARYSLVLGE